MTYVNDQYVAGCNELADTPDSEGGSQFIEWKLGMLFKWMAACDNVQVQPFQEANILIQF